MGADAVAEPGYTPLVQLPDGTVLNAPHVANGSGRADRIRSLTGDRVVFELTSGFYEDEQVLYVSTGASDPVAAALENATYAPALAAAPREVDIADEQDAASAVPIVVAPERQAENDVSYRADRSERPAWFVSPESRVGG